MEKKWCIDLKNKYNLTNDDIDEFIFVFRNISRNGDINPKKLAIFVNKEVSKKKSFSENECCKFIQKINLLTNGVKNDTLDIKTFLLYMIPICKLNAKDNFNMREFFDSLDSDGDGNISYAELILLLSNIRKKKKFENKRKYNSKITNLCKEIDLDGDRRISYQEYEKFIKTMQGNIMNKTMRKKYG